MGKYGDTAVEAAVLLRNGYRSAEDAWRVIAGEVFRDAPAARGKVCPRETFLGLCQAGLIRGVPATSCIPSNSGLNRGYSVAAVRLLAAEPNLARQGGTELWRRVMSEVGADSTKRHNQQMDVVLSLWNKGLISS